MYVYKYTSFTDPGATAYDDHDGSVSVQTAGSVDTSTPATYTLTYRATDSVGNRAVTQRTVIVKYEIKPQVLVDTTAPKDDEEKRPSNVVDDFIKAFLEDDEDKVSQLVGANENLLEMLYNKQEATDFLKRIYSHTYKIEGKHQTAGDASVTVSFVDAGGHHKGGFELAMGTNTDGERVWIITMLY